MCTIRSDAAGRAYPLSLCYVLCLCITWVQVTSALIQAETVDYGLVARTPGGVGLIPSAPRSNVIPSAPVQSPTYSSELVIPTPLPTDPVPSQPSQASQVPPLLPPGLIPSAPAPSGSIPSAPLPPPNPGPIPSGPIVTDGTSVVIPSPGNATGTPGMQSTDQGLRPIPPAETQVGDPNGHHEITEPNFTSTRPCRGCSPVIEISATGWLDNPAEQQHDTAEGQTQQTTTERPAQQTTTDGPAQQSVTEEPARVTVPVGLSNIIISQEPTGRSFVLGESTTLTPGQSITIDDTPIVIQTFEGRTEVVVGTTAIPLKPNVIDLHITDNPRITDAPIPLPLPPVLTIGTETITANAQTQYIIAHQTLVPGGTALTISGTTLSLAPSATALVVNGETSSLAPLLGNIYTTTMPAALTFNNHVYTANRAGYILMGPGSTLIPGGSPITVDGTTLSLEHSGTAVIVQGTTSALQPVITVVTLTRAPGDGGHGIVEQSTGDGYVYPTEKPIPASATLRYGHMCADVWLGGLVLLVWWGLGYFAIWL